MARIAGVNIPTNKRVTIGLRYIYGIGPSKAAEICDKLSIPDALALARKQGLLERNLDLEHASYFVSRITITPTDAPGMRPWRKQLFIAMARNASSAIEHFGLPADRTVIMGSQVAL